jgi:hypothetical protein
MTPFLMGKKGKIKKSQTYILKKELFSNTLSKGKKD